MRRVIDAALRVGKERGTEQPVPVPKGDAPFGQVVEKVLSPWVELGNGIPSENVPGLFGRPFRVPRLEAGQHSCWNENLAEKKATP